MFPLKPLDDQQRDWCLNTISSNAFYLLVGDALSRGNPLSVVRMADGELALLKACREALDKLQPSESLAEAKPPQNEDDEWLDRFGIRGITNLELWNRLVVAATSCNFFAPSISGVHMLNYRMYDYFSPRARYVDNFFPNAWDNAMKVNLYRKAGHVLFIHRNRAMADALQIRCKYALGVKLTYLELNNWRQADSVIDAAKTIDAPLVIFSAGPGSKQIGPLIATTGKIMKVTLDIGQAAERWLLSHLMHLPQVQGRYVQLID